MKNSDDNVEE